MVVSDSVVISFIENFPVSASLKEADTGRYVINNVHNSLQFGVKNPKDIAGLTIQDLNFQQPAWGKLYARSIERLDFLARDKRSSVTGRHQFLDDCGEAQMEEMTKFPVLGSQGNIIGIVTYRNDITRTLSPINIYELYRNFYDSTIAVRRSAVFLGVDKYFLERPTEAQFRVFLLKSERFSTKEISRFLGISDRTVECHCLALRNKVVDGNLSSALSFVKGNDSCGGNVIPL